MLNYYENLKIDDLDSIRLRSTIFCLYRIVLFRIDHFTVYFIMLVKTVNTIIVEITSSYSEPAFPGLARNVEHVTLDTRYKGFSQKYKMFLF